MPFFFSTLRSQGATLSRGRVGDYERIPPSQFRYQAVNRPTTMVAYLTSFWMHYVVSLFMSILGNTLVYVNLSLKSAFVPLKMDQLIPLDIPDIGVCFSKGTRMTPEITTMLTKYGGTDTTRIISGKKSWNVHICMGVIAADLPFFKGIAKYTDSSYQSSSGFITPRQIDGYLMILSMISVQLLALRNAFQATGGSAGATSIVVCDDVNIETISQPIVSDDQDIDFTTPPIMNVEESEVIFDKVSEESSRRLAWTKDGDRKPRTAWGPMTLFNWSTGISLPFSTDTSMPDRNGISSSIQHHIRLLDRKTQDPDAPSLDVIVKDLDKVWRVGIMNTPQGEWIAHICACIDLAFRTNASLYCALSNGRYLGCILGGGKYFILADGKVFTPASGSDFQSDIEHINLHETTLQRICELLAIPIATTVPTTLRALRNMINPVNIDGETQNKVSELLPLLDFGTSIQSINTTTMMQAIDLLVLDNPIVPSSLYMDPEAFWSTEKEVLVLSMFGRRAPVFSTGQQQRRLSMSARGSGSQTVPKYDPKPPSVLQVVTRPLLDAARTWKGFMSTGMAKGEWEQEVKGNIVFRGQAKSDLWAHLNDGLTKAIGKSVGEEEGTKRKADDEDDLEPGEIPTIPKPKKQKESFSFF